MCAGCPTYRVVLPSQHTLLLNRFLNYLPELMDWEIRISVLCSNLVTVQLTMHAVTPSVLPPYLLFSGTYLHGFPSLETKLELTRRLLGITTAKKTERGLKPHNRIYMEGLDVKNMLNLPPLEKASAWSLLNLQCLNNSKKFEWLYWREIYIRLLRSQREEQFSSSPDLVPRQRRALPCPR